MPALKLNRETREVMAARNFLGEKQICLAEEYGVTQQAVSQAAKPRFAAFRMIYEAGIREGIKRAREEREEQEPRTKRNRR